MTRYGRVTEWYRFFGVRTPIEAASELHKLIARLDDTYHQLTYVAKLLAGSPNVDVEEEVRMARTSVDAAIEELTHAMKQMHSDDPDAA
jgi:hypothetical protein